MTVDAEFIVKIKLNDLIFSNNISGVEMKERLLQEGDKRLRYLTSGFLQDPEGKIISKEVTYKIKED